jgi:hypothetical protein
VHKKEGGIQGQRQSYVQILGRGRVGGRTEWEGCFWLGPVLAFTSLSSVMDLGLHEWS